MKRFKIIFLYLVSIHLVAMLMLTICRVLFVFLHFGQISDPENKFNLITTAMLRGLKFDNLIICYIAVVPTVVLLLTIYFSECTKTLIKIVSGYYIVLITLVFAITISDIPYFAYFASHINASVFAWVEFEGSMDMVLEESSYYPYFVLFIVYVLVFTWAVIYISKKAIKANDGATTKPNLQYTIPLTLLVLAIVFAGIRGSFQRYPLRVSESYFCSHPFINQIALNPTFFLIKTSSSYFKKYSNISDVIDEKRAVSHAKRYLGIENGKDSLSLARYVAVEGEGKRPNIVMILMESMSYVFLDKKTAEGKPLTPYINKLIGESYYFDNFFASGIHTNNAVAAGLYGFPPQFNKTMMSLDADNYYGLPHRLRDLDYKTMFFLTHTPNFDNMAATLYNNGFDELHSEFDYPSEKVVNAYGVQDDYLFEYGLEKLNASKTPFFAALLTISTHAPYVVPEAFKNFSASKEEALYAFADHSIEVFMEQAKKEEWYDNTIFILFGDHGRPAGNLNYDIPLSNNKVPLIIYSPLFNDTPKVFSQFGTQVDIYPTTMGLIHQPYTNNTLGIDLLKEERPYAYFVNDNAMGCIDEEFYYIYNVPAKQDFLYRYTSDAPVDNVIEQYKSVADSMKQYSASMMITSNYLIREKLTGEN